jgi:HD-GYP domain-containing protein (c-di-GMP phosphodiesterase class II)
MSVAEATEMIEREAGRQFDPAVVAAFKARLGAIVAILRRERAKQTTQPDQVVLEKVS